MLQAQDAIESLQLGVANADRMVELFDDCGTAMHDAAQQFKVARMLQAFAQHGPWAMGHGQWALNHGPWAMGHGGWP